MRKIEEIKADLRNANDTLRTVHGGKVTSENRDAVKEATDKVLELQRELTEAVNAQEAEAELRRQDAEADARARELLSSGRRQPTGDAPPEVLDPNANRAEPEWLTRFYHGQDAHARSADDMPEDVEAIANWVRGRVGQIRDLTFGGWEDMREFRAAGDPLKTTPDASGGYLIAEDNSRMRTIVESMIAYMGVEKYAEILTTTNGAPFPIPKNNDTANQAEEVAEAVNANAPAEVVLDEVKLEAHKVGTGDLPISSEMLQDSAPAIEDFIMRLLGRRMGKRCALRFASGDGGAAQGRGILTATNKGADLDYSLATKALKNPEKAGNTIARAVSLAYRRMAGTVILLSDDLMGSLQTAIGTDGHFVYPNLAFMGPDDVRRLHGHRVDIEPNYPTYGAANGNAAKMATVGDHRQFIIRKVRGMRFQRDPYSSGRADRIIFRGWKRYDCDLADELAVQHVLVTTRTN